MHKKKLRFNIHTDSQEHTKSDKSFNFTLSIYRLLNKEVDKYGI